MIKHERVLAKFAVISMFLISSVAADVLINDSNTTGVSSDGTENITVTNAGSITVSDNDVRPIDINATLLIGKTILNEGNILHNDNNDSIYIEEDNNGTIHNTSTGTIYSKSRNAIHIKNDSNGLILNDGNITSGGSSISMNANDGNITNNGTITSNYSSVIYMATNKSNGTITNNNYMNSKQSSVIEITDANFGNIINNGTMKSDRSAIIVDDTYGNITNNGTMDSFIAIEITNVNFGTITNNKTITASQYGIKISSRNDGTILNNGTINSNSRGIKVEDNLKDIINNTNGTISSKNKTIEVANDNKQSGIIANLGSLESKENNAITVYNTNYGTITNSGKIKAYELGIFVATNDGTDTNKGIITNSGKIESTNNGGIWISTNKGTITNELGGTISSQLDSIHIETLNDNNSSIINDGSLLSTEGNGLYVSNTNNGNVINSGKITSLSKNGIYVEDNNETGIVSNTTGATINAKLDAISIFNDNNGTISNSGSLVADRNGIYLDGTNLKDITNDGSIKSGSYGIKIQANNYGTILNASNGVINSEKDAIYVTLDSNNSIINNGSLIAKGSGIRVDGAEIGTITNNGSITGEYALYILNDLAVETFINTGTTTGKIHAKGMAIVNNGRVNLNPNDNVESATYTQASNAVLSVGMNINSSTLATQTSTIKTDGNITFENGSTINVKYTNTTRGSIIKWLNTLKFSTKDGYRSFKNSEGLIATTTQGNIVANVDKLNFTDDSVLLEVSAINDGKSMNLVVKKDPIGLEKLVKKQGVSSDLSVATSLDHIYSSDYVNDDIIDFLAGLDDKNTDEEKVAQLVKATPTSTIATTTVLLRTFNTMSQIISSNQSSGRGLNSGDEYFTNKHLWIKPYTSYATQNNKDYKKGFSARTKGFVMGMDGEYKGASKIGVAFAYGSTTVDTNDIAQSSDIDSLTLICYGSEPIIDSKTNIDYQAGVGIQKVDSTREIDLISKTASGKYNSNIYYVQAALKREFELKDKLSFSPILSTAYRYFHTPSYNESGAGGMNLNVNGYNTSELVVGTGGTFAYMFNQLTNISATANLNYDVINDEQTISSSFQGGGDTVFETDGIKNSPLAFRAALDFNRKLFTSSTLSFGYSLDKRNTGFTSHSAYAKYDMKF